MSHPSLFQPLNLGSMVIANRIGLSAMTRNRATDTVPTTLMREYYAQRARGGARLIVTEGILITQQGTEWPDAPGIWDKKAHVPAWKEIVDAVHAEGSKIYAQLWHVGRVAHPEAPQQKVTGEPVWAPSAVSAQGGKFRFLEGQPGYITPTELSDPQILVNAFKLAAINAKDAGFDGVELHAANGYLIDQFLDSKSNLRADRWGGSIENRSRFGLEVLKALKEVFGLDVSMKVSPNGGYNDMRMSLDETLSTFTHFIKEADKLGLSYIALRRFSPFFDPETNGETRSTQHDVVADFSAVIKHSKLFVNAGVSIEEGALLIESGKVDGIFIGVNWLTHPDLAKRIENGTPLDNAPDFAHLYGTAGLDPRIGYTDYPEALAT